MLKEAAAEANLNMSFQFLDDDCRQELATQKVITASLECADVIFGPICDYCLASVGRVAKYIGNFGIPVITSGGFATDFTKEKRSCEDEFYMTVNTGSGDYRSFAEFFHLMVNTFGWAKFAFMYEKNYVTEVVGDSACQLFMSGIIEEVKYKNKFEYHDGDLVLLKLSHSEYLRTVIGVDYGSEYTKTNNFSH